MITTRTAVVAHEKQWPHIIPPIYKEIFMDTYDFAWKKFCIADNKCLLVPTLRKRASLRTVHLAHPRRFRTSSFVVVPQAYNRDEFASQIESKRETGRFALINAN